jgi:hypothetical protein
MLTEIDLDSIHYIAFHMRESDKAEIFNLLDHDCPYQFGVEAFETFNNYGRARIGWHNGKPAAVLAVVEERPSVWYISMFGTDDLKHVAHEIIRWSRHNTDLLDPPHNARRMHCDSRVGHEDAHNAANPFEVEAYARFGHHMR